MASSVFLFLSWTPFPVVFSRTCSSCSMPVTISVTTVPRRVTLHISFAITSIVTRRPSHVVVIPVIPGATVSLLLAIPVTFSVPFTVAVPIPVIISVPVPFSFPFAVAVVTVVPVSIPIPVPVSVTWVPVALSVCFTMTRFFALAASCRGSVLRDLPQTFLQVNEYDRSCKPTTTVPFAS